MVLFIAKARSTLLKLCNPDVNLREDINSIPGITGDILDIMISELDRNGVIESSRMIRTVQEKKNKVARLVEIFNNRGQPLLPWLTTAAAPDVPSPAATVHNNVVIDAVDSQENMEIVTQDEIALLTGIADAGLGLTSPSSSLLLRLRAL